MPVLFRTYRSPNAELIDCPVWEAALATSVNLDIFVDVPGLVPLYTDSGVCNNPTPQVLDEAGYIFPGRRVACIINVGAGHAKTIAIQGIPFPVIVTAA